MTLQEFKSLLQTQTGSNFQIQLPGGKSVPLSFHITEVGRVQKTFIDCGNTLREHGACQLQIWVGPDVDHRLEAGKALKILEKAKAFLPDENIPVEIEYEDQVISQYTIAAHELRHGAVILKLAHKHTDCLAPELCLVPGNAGVKVTSCCGPKGCC